MAQKLDADRFGSGLPTVLFGYRPLASRHIAVSPSSVPGDLGSVSGAVGAVGDDGADGDVGDVGDDGDGCVPKDQ